jgi:hypothetical protein
VWTVLQAATGRTSRPPPAAGAPPSSGPTAPAGSTTPQQAQTGRRSASLAATLTQQCLAACLVSLICVDGVQLLGLTAAVPAPAPAAPAEALKQHSTTPTACGTKPLLSGPHSSYHKCHQPAIYPLCRLYQVKLASSSVVDVLLLCVLCAAGAASPSPSPGKPSPSPAKPSLR